MVNQQLQREFGRRIGEVARLWRGTIDRELKPMGLSFMQWLTLSQLAECGEALVQKELAARLGMEGPAMVAILDRLVRAGLVERRVSHNDRRANTVHLTQSGEAMLVTAEQALIKGRQKLLGGLHEATLSNTAKVLEAIIERARKPRELNT
ncbi:MAG: MarR family transcriptional regulator [Gammaproteobacteria bacterium]|nr:MarR family transcriptional regulator [Gammaproteobacteria bacterium]